MKKIVLLGATGSIGTQTIDVVNHHRNEFSIIGLSAGHNMKKLSELLEVCPDVKYVCVARKADMEEMQKMYPSLTFFCEDKGLEELASLSDYDIFVNAIVGFRGLLPTLSAIKNQKVIALANKESLVAGGPLVKAALKKYNVPLYPIDSEHSAIFQCLQGSHADEVDKLIITASGGSFRDKTREELKDADIRNAIGLSINRANVLKALGYGDNAYELNGLIPKGIPGATGDFREEQDAVEKLATYNLDEAKAIMTSKGYSESNMLKLTYTYNDNTMHKNVAQAMQASMKEAYIDLTLSATEGEAFFDARDKGDFEICRHAMTADFIDPMAYLSMYVGSTTPGNIVDDAKYEELVAAANAIDDKTERMNALHAAENYLVGEQHYVIPLFGYAEPYLMSSKVTGVTHSPEGHYQLAYAKVEK